MKPILMIGEAWGSNEARVGNALVGPSGAALLQMCDEAGLITLTSADNDFIRGFYTSGDPRQIDMVWRLHPELARTNVFNLHPPGNDLETLCGTRKEGITGWPALTASKYLLPEYAHELDRLALDIAACDPDLIICLGNTPLWATCGITKISKHRGTTRLADRIGARRKVLPIYHPAAVLRDWSLRPLTILDLTKANREKDFSDVRRPRREIWIEPALDDIHRFREDHIRGCPLLSVDIETSGTRVTCIGFAPRTDLALVVPFDDPRTANKSYWSTAADERAAWEIIRSILVDREVKKLFQNGNFDVSFLWRSYGIQTLGAAEDTMLLSHALQPELMKGLGFLGSCWTDEGSWKMERRDTSYKKDA